MDSNSFINKFCFKFTRFRFIGFIALVFSIFILNPLDSFAYTYVPEDIKITFWNSQNQTDSCEGLSQCYNFLPDKIANRVQTQTRKISFTEGRSYKMYISLKLSVPNEYYIYDFYLSDYNLRNYSINVDYNNITFLYWDDFGWFNAYQWDLVLTVTPTFTSEGVSFDFYKNQAYNQAIWILDVLDFHSELLADSSDTGLIIDNNNKNTQDIIDNQNKNHEESEETRKSIWDSIKELPSKFFDMLISLFIPDDFSFLDNFKITLQNKLGFIAEIPISILDFLINLASVTWEPFDSISFPSIELFGVNFWDSQEISLQPAIEIFEPYKYITDLLCVILCCNTLLHWYKSFTNGGGN